MTLCWVELAEPQTSEETLGSPLPLGGEELLGHAGLPVLPPRVRPQLLQRAVIQLLPVLRRELVIIIVIIIYILVFPNNSNTKFSKLPKVKTFSNWKESRKLISQSLK